MKAPPDIDAIIRPYIPDFQISKIELDAIEQKAEDEKETIEKKAEYEKDKIRDKMKPKLLAILTTCGLTDENYKSREIQINLNIIRTIIKIETSLDTDVDAHVKEMINKVITPRSLRGGSRKCRKDNYRKTRRRKNRK